VSVSLDLSVNRASAQEILQHLLNCEASFVSMLNSRVDIRAYANKIYEHAIRFEAWVEGSLVGLAAIYCNDTNHVVAFVTNVSVLSKWQRHGIASILLDQCVAYATECCFHHVELEVMSENGRAISLYKRKGFTIDNVEGCSTIMSLNLHKDNQ